MKRMLIAAASAVALAPAAGLAQPSGDTYSPYVDAEGNISRPANYASDWTHLGSWAVVNDEGVADSVHNVYTEDWVVEAFLETGAWPDGATLVKEVRNTESAYLPTGNAHWTTTPNVWFVMVKDAEGRFPENPLWGEGWGWALFGGDAPDTQIATSYEGDCLGCHIPAQESDWTYSYAYPILGVQDTAPGSGE